MRDTSIESSRFEQREQVEERGVRMVNKDKESLTKLKWDLGWYFCQSRVHEQWARYVVIAVRGSVRMSSRREWEREERARRFPGQRMG